MKTIVLTRHAKSDWSLPGQTDYDRTLSERGLRDAPMMGKRLNDRKLLIDKVVSSTARRAAQTAKLIANEIEIDESNFIWVDRLYHASPQVIQDVLIELDDDIQSIVLVCHNNGLTDFVNSLDKRVTHDMPTCAMAAFEININSWSDFSIAKKKLIFYDFPKNC